MKITSKLPPHTVFVIIEILFVTVIAQTNLAVKGNVDQHSTLTDANGTVYSANLAIEGPVSNNWEDGCSSTDQGQAVAWWALVLPRVAFMTSVVIYFRGDSRIERKKELVISKETD
ncbi:uncharacterized protein LOC127700360 isoform X2 [Mytilus californianus]|uniref:uncharacterized protein LOC127700360 isoform X2 n=1 Tax=Mytilus californianus TaxID=6549 RepID=UPI002247E038|nr:uncharacterized protein LOC127700360 isoform X2 [Mytilus californianus]